MAKKVVILTENQLQNIILHENVMANVKKYGKLCFRGCKTAGDYFNRAMLLLGTTSLTLVGIICMIKISDMPNDTKQEVISRIEENYSQQQENGNAETLDFGKATNDSAFYNGTFQMTNDGVSLLKNIEGLRLEKYNALKSEKYKTIGYGHYMKDSDPDWLKKCDKITKEQAEELFTKDLGIYTSEAERFLRNTNPSLLKKGVMPKVFNDVLISLMYNAGYGNIAKTEFAKRLSNCRVDNKTGKINLEDYKYTLSVLPKTCIRDKDGVVVKGLISRRDTEMEYALQAVNDF